MTFHLYDGYLASPIAAILETAVDGQRRLAHAGREGWEVRR